MIPLSGILDRRAITMQGILDYSKTSRYATIVGAANIIIQKITNIKFGGWRVWIAVDYVLLRLVEELAIEAWRRFGCDVKLNINAISGCFGFYRNYIISISVWRHIDGKNTRVLIIIGIA